MEGEWPSSRLTGHSTLITKAQALRQSCNLSCIVSLPNRNRVLESQRAIDFLGQKVVEVPGKRNVVSFMKEGTRFLLSWNQRFSQAFPRGRKQMKISTHYSRGSSISCWKMKHEILAQVRWGADMEIPT